MIKIGVVSNVKYDVQDILGINNNLKNDYLIYVSKLSISIYDEKSKVLKKINIECENYDYNNKKNNTLYLGDIIEYDTELKTVKKVKNLTDENIKEIDLISKKYINRLNWLKEKKFSTVIDRCSSIEELKQFSWFLRGTNKFEQQMDKIRITNILMGISDNLDKMENVTCNHFSTLSNETLSEIINKVENKIKLSYKNICDSECNDEKEFNRLLMNYLMYKYYVAIANSRNLDGTYINLVKVKTLLKEKGLLPIKIGNNDSKNKKCC